MNCEMLGDLGESGKKQEEIVDTVVIGGKGLERDGGGDVIVVEAGEILAVVMKGMLMTTGTTNEFI